MNCDNCRGKIYKNNKYLMCQILYSDENTKKMLNVNLNDYGRVRTFRRAKFTDWNSDPIPLDIYSNRFNVEDINSLDVQMIEVGICNLHCWWCYLPDIIRKINSKYMNWFSAKGLIDMLNKENSNCRCLYISGGNPELVPELVYEIMVELKSRNLDDKILLWSDDVLTTDYLLNMDSEKIKYMVNYKNYAKICCLKGFDEDSFSFNTLLDKKYFNEQLDRLKKYIELGFDVYSYIIFTCNNLENVSKKLDILIKKLQDISYNLPLRIIPIKIEEFSAVSSRLNVERKHSLDNQYTVLRMWNEKIKKYYSKEELNKNIASIKL